MTGVKAEWHLDELMDKGDDPFDTVLYSSGIPIDLDGDSASLADTFVEMLKMEERMSKRGINCHLKREKGQDCRTCPVATMDRDEPRSRLCRLGKDQVTVLARYEVREAERKAPFMELAGIADEATEMGHLDDELVEWLTAVGL